MRSFLLLLVASLGIATLPARAEDDPGDLFVKAYMLVQQGEKLEQQDSFKAAAGKLQAATRILDQIAEKHPKWQPQIVSYRKQRTTETIQRVQEKLTKFGPGKADTEMMATTEPALPGNDNPGLIFTPPSEMAAVTPAPERMPGTSRRGNEGGSGNPIQEIQERMDRLQNDLASSQKELQTAVSDKSRLAKELEEAVKARESSEKKQQVLQKRADIGEQALMEAVARGDKESEAAKLLRADLDSVKKQLREIKIDGEAEGEYRTQLNDRLKASQSKIKLLTDERNTAQKASADVPGKIAAIQMELDKAKKEKEEVLNRLAKVETQLATVTVQRDDAMKQVESMKDAQKRVDALVTENTQLMAKLGEAEKNIRQFKVEGEQKDVMIAGLKKEVLDAKKQLVAAQAQSADYQRQMFDLQSKLSDTSKQLTEMKAASATNVAERKKLVDENQILRGIVLRQQKEQAHRDQVKKLVLGELAKLEIKSKSLLDQIDYLGQPVVKLTQKELGLFKTPALQISDTEIAVASAKPEQPELPALPEKTPAIADAAPVEEPKPADPLKMIEQPTVAELPKPVDAAPAEQPAPVAEAAKPMPPEEKPALTLDTKTTEMTLAKNTTPTLPTGLEFPPEKPVKSMEKPATEVLPGDGTGTSSATPASNAPNVPAELLPLAREGKDQFERANYRDAEKTYERMFAKAPNNLYILSNLGVVRFRAGKLKLAEEALIKATKIAPEDSFAHCTLGIVYYSQGKYDEAVNSLTKALAINPKNATAHNYLGITASQKGWQEAALKELETATALDPTYADAHFNLAVVFATQSPPNKENARKFYKRATELGAEPDSALEQLIK